MNDSFGVDEDSSAISTEPPPASQFYNQAMKSCQGKIAHLESMKSEYGQVVKMLDGQVGQAVDQVVDINIGSVATIPAHIQPDAPLLVLLGDNWFAECSRPQASAIAGRRLQRVQQSIESLNADLQTLQTQLQTISKAAGSVSNDDASTSASSSTTTTTGKKSFNRTVINKPSPPSTTKDVSPSAPPSKVSKEDFDALMAHLDRLEADEEAEDEEMLDSDDQLSEEYEATSENNEEKTKNDHKRAFEEFVTETNSVKSKEKKEEKTARKTSKVCFQETASEQTYSIYEPPNRVINVMAAADPPQAESAPIQIQTTPTPSESDCIPIVNDDGVSEQSQTASILRNRNESTPVDYEAPLIAEDKPVERKIIPMPSSMFSEIVERTVDPVVLESTKDADNPMKNTKSKPKSLFAKRR